VTEEDHSAGDPGREDLFAALEEFRAARDRLGKLVSVEGLVDVLFVDPLKRVSNPSDPVQRAAYVMAKAGVFALLLGDPEALDLVRRFRAMHEKAESEDTLAIREIHEAVAMNVYAWTNRDDVEILEGGERAPELLHAFLKGRFGLEAPLEAACKNWLEGHSPTKLKGKFTTVAIVAEILIHTGAFGTPKQKRTPSNRERTRDRVRKALGK
jgi:hypothetical protein